jgi:hypothetical protein
MDNNITRGQAMVHAKRLQGKGMLDEREMKALKEMAADKDFDGEDLLSEMSSSIQSLQHKMSDAKKAAACLLYTSPSPRDES